MRTDVGWRSVGDGDVDDVGRALDLARQRELPIVMDFGRHPNDRVSSFYVRTPAGLEVEYAILMLYARDAGQHGALLQFGVENSGSYIVTNARVYCTGSSALGSSHRMMRTSYVRLSSWTAK